MSYCPRCQAQQKVAYDGKTACVNGHKFLTPYWQEWNQKQEKVPKTQKGWATPYGFIDFGHAVTFEHAMKVAKTMNQKENYDANAKAPVRKHAATTAL